MVYQTEIFTLTQMTFMFMEVVQFDIVWIGAQSRSLLSPLFAL